MSDLPNAAEGGRRFLGLCSLYLGGVEEVMDPEVEELVDDVVGVEVELDIDGENLESGNCDAADVEDDADALFTDGHCTAARVFVPNPAARFRSNIFPSILSSSPASFSVVK
jgi:hypothetical protein